MTVAGFAAGLELLELAHQVVRFGMPASGSLPPTLWPDVPWQMAQPAARLRPPASCASAAIGRRGERGAQYEAIRIWDPLLDGARKVSAVRRKKSKKDARSGLAETGSFAAGQEGTPAPVPRT
jgi:hypothetical protein